jgi:Transposase
VAMEATGVYWKPVWNILSDGDFELVLANAAHIKNVAGRKTDVSDAAWISDLLAHGLIRSSFVPQQDQQELRDLLRTRKQLIRQQGSHIQRLQKTLQSANIKLDSVITDIVGKSGLAIISALIAGETNPTKLATLADWRIRASQQELREALRGRVKHHHRFLLHLHLQHIDFADFGHRRHRSQSRRAQCPDGRGGKGRSGPLSNPDPPSENHPGNSPGSRASHLGGDRPRYDPVPHCRAPALMGRLVPKQQRERRKTRLHSAAEGEQLAQGLAGSMCLGR